MSKYKTQGLLLGTVRIVNRPISTREVSNYSKVCWKTARDNLETLFKLGLVLKGEVKSHKKIYWKNAE